MSDKILQLIDDGFENDVIKVVGLVLVDFWVEWCGFCKMIVLILDEVVDEYVGKFIIGKLNIDYNVGILFKFGICGILILLLFKDGSVVVIKVGVLLKI